MRKEQEKILARAKKYDMADSQILMLSREDMTIKEIAIIFDYFRWQQDINGNSLATEAERCMQTQKRKEKKYLHRQSILRGKRAGMSKQATNGNNSILEERGIIIDPKSELYANSIPTNKQLLTICLSVLNGKWCSYEDNIPNGEMLKVMKECQKYILPMEAVIHMSKSKVYKQERVLSYRQIACVELTNELLTEKRYVAALHEFMDAIDDFGIVRKEDREITIAEYILYKYTINKFITFLEQEII